MQCMNYSAKFEDINNKKRIKVVLSYDNKSRRRMDDRIQFMCTVSMKGQELFVRLRFVSLAEF
jgi:hypothetical protein